MTISFRRAIGSSLAFGLLVLSAPAHAAPVAVGYTFSISYDFESPWPAPLSGVGVVDVSGGTLTIPAGFVTIPSVVVPVSSSTAVDSPIVFQDIVNATGTFRLGGVASQAPAELCPAPTSRYACDVGGGIGGIMPMLGTLFLPIAPSLSFTIPVDFATARVGVGGSTSMDGVDAAAWTTGTARVGKASTTLSFFGTSGPGSLSFVTPTYLAFLDSYLNLELTLSPLTLVPEPSGLVLIALGVCGLWLTARR